MKTALIHGPRDLRLEEVSAPDPGPEDVLVRVRASGICGSDVHRYLGTDYGRLAFPYPMNSGHEYCGDVVAVGEKVCAFAEGDRVTLGVAWTAGDLGAFSQFVVVRQADYHLHRLPRDMRYLDGALLETFEVAIRSFARPAPTPDEHILILGAGPIGLSVLLYCRAMGLEHLVVSEPSAVRRELAGRLGARTVDPAEEDLAEVVSRVTGDRGMDVTFECAGQESTLHQAFDLTRPGERISLIGHYRMTPEFNIEKLVMRGMSVYGPVNGHIYFDEAIDLVAAGRVDLAQLVSHQYPLEQAREAFDMACDVNQSVKVVFSLSA